MLRNYFFATVLFLFILSSFAIAIPGIPHQFYGTVTVNGNPAHGASIEAKISNVVVADTNSTNGTYGYYPNVFFVTDPNNRNNGKKIEFFLSGTKVAEQAFETGGSSQLDLILGTNPARCGDTTCDASENCSSCPADCGTCQTPGGGGGSGGGGGGGGGSGGSGGDSGGGGGGSSTTVNTIALAIDGNCIGKTITLATKVNRTVVSNVEITVMHNQKQVDKKSTDSSGIASFVFNDVGKYTFSAEKRPYGSNSQIIDLKDCSPAPVNNIQPVIETSNPCSEINCDDKNPCTKDSCTNGVCVYSANAAANGTACANGLCQSGVCITPPAQLPKNPPSFTGFFGLGMLGNIIAGILVLFGILSFASFYKKKFSK